MRLVGGRGSKGLARSAPQSQARGTYSQDKVIAAMPDDVDDFSGLRRALACTLLSFGVGVDGGPRGLDKE